MPYYLANEDDRACFLRDGFVLVRGLFHADEVQQLAKIAREDGRMQDGATERRDAGGNRTVLAVRDNLSDDVYSSIVRCRRVSQSMSVLLGEEVYHYHHKLMLKEPRVGGAWEWHQDYGYWYGFGCLFPNMASCYIAIDQATRENGCLQVLPRSHQLGRLEHGKVGGQTGADPERMEAVLRQFDISYVQMDPGDGLFFHANLLHRSDMNSSDQPRWSLICCYNTKSNSPYELKRHNGYQPLDPLEDKDVFPARG